MAHIHHVQICVRNGIKCLQKFTRNANFELFATRRTPTLRQWAIRSGSTVFLITDTTEEDLHVPPHRVNRSPSASGCSENVSIKRETLSNSSLVSQHSEPVLSQTLPDECFLEPCRVPTTSDSGFQQTQLRDTVFNVAFEVSNIADVVARVEENGAKVQCPPTVVRCSKTGGHVTIATVQSCVGNVVHTLIDRTQYSGVFLPGFVAVTNKDPGIDVGTCLRDDGLADCYSTRTHQSSEDLKDDHSPLLTSHIDHVTFAVPVGTSSQVLEWYEKCFGMKRFLLMSEESESDGFIVQDKNVGLRMKAMEYWHCAETGLALPSDGDMVKDGVRPRPPKAKFVIAEALPGHGPNQVETFLEQHGDAGIQHIGLHTHNIIHAVRTLRHCGMSFIDPPAAYYTQVGKLTEICRIRDDLELLRRMGILLDEEASTEDDSDSVCRASAASGERTLPCKYLMQVFTKPIFERDTFFLEVIQRQGATGFGAGNIRALWRAVQSYMSYDDL